MKLYKKLLKRIENGEPIYCNETFAKDLEAIANKHFEQLILPVVVKQSELFECRNVACNKMVKRNSGTVFCKKHRNL